MQRGERNENALRLSVEEIGIGAFKKEEGDWNQTYMDLGEAWVSEERMLPNRSGRRREQSQEHVREWNWLHLFEEIASETELEVYCTGPLILRRLAEQRLRAGKTEA